jgi:hypothetical protein
VKGREKDRSHPLMDKKGHLKFGPSFKGPIQKKGRRNTKESWVLSDHSDKQRFVACWETLGEY